MSGSRSRENAAAFIIAEFLKVNYLQVIVYAVIPIFLYYQGTLLATERQTPDV